ncbi:MAG: hypothetical protein HZA54_06295 [Planctomycetes bacterium]|nr:hypothetical protein [Planctomycetota bacterium]
MSLLTDPAGADGPPAAPRAARPALLGLCVVVACLLAYRECGECDFIWDDVPAVRENSLLADLATLPRLFRTPYPTPEHGTGLYRPLLMASFALDRAWLGHDSVGYHAMNLAWHALAALAVFALLRRVSGDDRIAAAAALLFAVHPVHVEAVAGLVGRADLMATAFTLLALLACERACAATGRTGVAAWAVVAAACYALGLLCKEAAVVTPALAVLVVCCRPPDAPGASAALLEPRRVARRLAWVLGGQLLALAAYLLARRAVVGGLGVGDAVLVRSGIPPFARLPVMGPVLLDYLRMLVLPLGLSGSYAVNSRPDLLRAAAVDPVGWAAAAALALGAAAVFAYRRSFPALAAGAAWFGLALAPVANLLLPIGTIKAERLLYLPSVGACWALGAGVMACVRRGARPGASAWARGGAAALLPALLFAGIVGANLRVRVWWDAESFWRDVLAVQPGDPAGHIGLGFAHYEAGLIRRANGAEGEGAAEGAELAAAVEEFRTAGRLSPGMVQAHVLEGEARAALGDRAGALAALERAFEVAPTPDLRMQRGLARLENGDAAGGRADLELACREAPGSARAWNALALLERAAGRFAAAADCAGRALECRPDFAPALFNRGAALVDGGRPVDALPPLARLVALEPAHAGGLAYQGIARLSAGGAAVSAAAAADLARALDLDPGLFATAAGPLAEALEAAGDGAGAARVRAEIGRRRGEGSGGR